MVEVEPSEVLNADPRKRGVSRIEQHVVLSWNRKRWLKSYSCYRHTVPGARNTCRVIALLCVALLAPSPRSTL